MPETLEAGIPMSVANDTVVQETVFRADEADGGRVYNFPNTGWAEMTTLETQMRYSPRNVADDYARQLHSVWPEAEIYVSAPREPETVRVLVVAQAVDLDMEDKAYELMWTAMADAADVSIDVDVWFQDRCAHDLSGLVRLV